MSVPVFNGALVSQEPPFIQPLSLGLGIDGLWPRTLLGAAAHSSAAQSYPLSATEGLDIFLLLRRVIVCYSGRR